MDKQNVSVDMEPVTTEHAPFNPSRPRPRPYHRAHSAFLPGVEPSPLRCRPTSYPDGICLDESSRSIFTVLTQPGELQASEQLSQPQLSYRTTSNHMVGNTNTSRQYQSSVTRPLRQISRPTLRTQPFLSEPVLDTGICSCQCQCGNMRNKVNVLSASGDGSPPCATGEMTPEDLSWRRLHMSRAKLKATATTSELLAGFAMVAMVELQINEDTNVPEWLFVLFSVCTTVLVAVHIFALMISTYLLPNIDAVSKLHVRGVIDESPHERMRGFIELAWAFSTVLGLFLFLVEVAILCWVKFWDFSFTAAWAATIIVVPVLVIFVAFAVHFYHTLVVYKVKTANTDIRELEELRLKLESPSISHV